MMRALKLCFATVTVACCVLGKSVVQQSKPTSVLHLSSANFREAPGEVLFSADGKLYVAYRLPNKVRASSALRVVVYDPVTGLVSNVRDYPVPTVSLPRVASDFILSQDDSTLAFAELHAPEVLVTIEAGTLRPLSTSDANLFGDQDFAPHVSAFSNRSLVLSAGELTHDGKVTAVHEVREVSLNPRNLREVVSEKTIPLEDDDGGKLSYWRKRVQAKKQVDHIVPLSHGALGLTNGASEGSIQLFDESGRELALLQNPDCGFVRASLSWDQQVGAAVCERTGLDESHFGETLRREAVVFEVKTLKVLATIPMSRMSVKERGPRRGDLWVAAPSPAVWHGKGRVQVAIPDFPDSINLYAVAGPAPTAH